MAEKVDLSEFTRSNWALASFSGSRDLLSFMGIGATGPHVIDPRHVPWDVIELMGHDPIVYLGEDAVSAPVIDPELYYVRRDDDALADETEAWLRPLLGDVLPMIVRAFAWGMIPVVLDWVVEDLDVRSEDGSVSTMTSHVHYGGAHEVHPGEAQIEALNDKVLWVRGPEGVLYGGEGAKNPGQTRGFPIVWGRQFGRFEGTGSRRRAHSDWHAGGFARLWRSRYLERSVDSVRVGYGPPGTIEVPGGESISAVELLRTVLQSLRGGSSVSLPAARDENGERVWEITTLDLPDRGALWNEAIDAHDLRVLRACLVRVSGDGTLEEEGNESVVQSVASFAAASLTRFAAAVHRLKTGSTKGHPVVLANDVPRAKKRLLKEILAVCADGVQKLKDGREYTLKELVHPEILEQLGVRARTVEEAAHEPVVPPSGGGPPGPDRDLSSDRESRRDAADGDEARNDTGAPDGGGREEAP